MLLRKAKLLLFLLISSLLSSAQTTTTITGTIKDLSQSVVTTGKITFTLKPGIDSTISGFARFTPQVITCGINGSGQVVNWTGGAPGTGSCQITMNTALSPPGTYYQVNICGYYACPQGALFNFNAYSSSVDISTITPTPVTAPNYAGSNVILTPVPVSFSATPVFQASSATLFQITLTGTVTSSSFPTGSNTGIAAGTLFDFQIIQDSIGGHPFVWPTTFVGFGIIDTTALPGSVFSQECVWTGTQCVAIGLPDIT